MLLGIFCECLLLAAVPVLVESASKLVAQMLSPNGCKGSKSTGSFDVAHKTNNDHLLKMLAIGRRAKRAALFVPVVSQ